MTGPPRKRKTTKRVEPKPPAESPGDISNTCYLCDGKIGPHDPVARAHELVIHRACYERDLKRGRSPGDPRR